MRRFAVLFFLSLSACGVAYIPAEIRQGEGDAAVQVVPLTSVSLLDANRGSRYVPRQLPSAFDATAGMGQGLRGLGALPEAPVQAELRPAPLQLRTPPNVTRGPYQIGVGDVLVLATPAGGNSVEELSGLLASQNRRQGYTVQDDGSITIPDVGRVQVGGATLSAAEDAIFSKLIENQIDPSFSVEISEFNSQRVSIGGAVRDPAVIPIRLGPVYLNEALAAVGGVETADPEFASVRIYRGGELYQIPLDQLNNNSQLQRLELLDGDSVFVDTQFRLDRAEAYFEQQIRVAELRRSARTDALNELSAEIAIRRDQLAEERSNFRDRLEIEAVERDYVYMTGEVGEQIRFAMPFERQSTLADALFEAGGVAESTGNPGQIYVLRDANNNGQVTAWHLDGSNVVNMVLATRFELRPNDVVFVAEQPVTRWNRVVQQMVPSLILSGVNAATN
ncbi:polysaccharide biosynthesis/export family protein [Octadecabacter ascidiaceicola]|uniref:Polysaccharide biosynthesis/export protein n=1 Tax=Octadecabacter ascidiaceicola TaxID=1655543 RepID=A0A238KQT6_9RHOB|nr:polysaccharide biosynthesis/export family protein [Octadecabacter ascidiaceicola]SMX45173.1 Polysaccharide biosynthesis/export protein [Octadecabacter ascidiaceicola]